MPRFRIARGCEGVGVACHERGYTFRKLECGVKGCCAAEGYADYVRAGDTQGGEEGEDVVG
jgi:hypothetical protein